MRRQTGVSFPPAYPPSAGGQGKSVKTQPLKINVKAEHGEQGLWIPLTP